MVLGLQLRPLLPEEPGEGAARVDGSEAGVFAAAFDKTGTRLITVEADKTIKMWKQDEDASETTHPAPPVRAPERHAEVLIGHGFSYVSPPTRAEST